jgi:hypothetical protein
MLEALPDLKKKFVIVQAPQKRYGLMSIITSEGLVPLVMSIT